MGRWVEKEEMGKEERSVEGEREIRMTGVEG